MQITGLVSNIIAAYKDVETLADNLPGKEKMEEYVPYFLRVYLVN